jgi:hypothetical protein
VLKRRCDGVPCGSFSVMSMESSRSLQVPSGVTFSGYMPLNSAGVPAAVRELASKEPMSKLVVAVIGGELWALRGPTATHASLAAHERFKVSFMRRAKGPGFVAIMAKPVGTNSPYVTLCEFGSFSEEGLSRASAFAQQLEPILGYVPMQEDWGADY